MKIALILTALITTAAAAYYLYLGSQAFRGELRDFVPTPDEGPEGVRDSVRQVSQLAETVHWRLDDGSRQRAFYVPSRNGALIIFAHGSPGAAAGFHPAAAALAEHGFGSLLVDMPGYGESEGTRNWGPTYRESIRKAVDFAQQQPGVNAQRIGGLGYSQGAHSMATAAAEDRRLAAIVLLAGYTNLYDQLHVQFRRRVPGMGFFAIAAAYSKGVDVLSMDTREAISRLDDRPVLVVSGTADHAIPVHMAETLADTAENSQLWLISGAGHAEFQEASGGEFHQRLQQFYSESLLQQTNDAQASIITNEGKCLGNI